ncbi:MAG: efflux RND transporter periplasmic adaptor subunit [Candidatus Kaiserbacteria bacterium]|nr:efflux RND transporter periplasmic adaptor subunit [Candidatus Kaiserbacteria bacterium]
MNRLKKLFVSHWVISSIAVLILVGGLWYVFGRAKNSYQFIPVTLGSITEVVSVTGNTTPTKSVSLGFQNTGTIARVNYNLGDQVSAGEIIAQLNTASLSAALQQAQAAYNSAVASRSSISLPEITTQARNAYLSAYTTLDTLLQNDIDTFFGGPTVYGSQLLIIAPNDYGELSKERTALTYEMQSYQNALSSVDTADPTALLTSATAVAQDISNFLYKLAVAANDIGSNATVTQITALATARAGVNTLLTTLSSARDTYLTKSVGATSLANASVEQAQAGVAVAKANLQGTEIIAPMSGVVTQQDAKVGQSASPGTQLVSIISNAGFEVDAGVSETDVGKLSVGNTVMMTLDAFPNETFAGTVFYIAPAQTNTQGVISYQIKISFDKPDPRLKSGLTANVDIQTRHKDSVLILPQYAILQNDNGTFVETIVGGIATTTPVVFGIQDQKGNVEILSGVTEGEQVINIGLKAPQ